VDLHQQQQGAVTRYLRHLKGLCSQSNIYIFFSFISLNMSTVAPVTNDILKENDSAVNKKAQHKMRKRNKKKSKKQRQEEEAQRKAVSEINDEFEACFAVGTNSVNQGIGAAAKER